MKYLILALLLVGCNKVELPKTIVDFFDRKPDKLWDRGPKYKGAGCFKVINKNNLNYGCTFYTYQGEMYMSDYGKNTYQWRIIGNKRIRCLTNSLLLVPETDVKKIKCPESLYH